MDTQKIIVLVLLVAVAAIDSKNFTIAGIKERLGKLFSRKSASGAASVVGNVATTAGQAVQSVDQLLNLGADAASKWWEKAEEAANAALLKGDGKPVVLPLAKEVPGTLVESPAYVRPVRHGLLVAQDLAYSLIDGGMTEDDAAKLIDPVLPHLVNYKEGNDAEPTAK